MNFVKEDHVINVTEEDVKFVREECNIVNEEDRNKAVDILAEWVKQQEHFVIKDFRRDYLERCYGTNRGSIEKAKKQIDKMCTFRTLNPHYFTVTNVMEHEMASLFQFGDMAILPKLTKLRHRVILFKYTYNDALPPNATTLFCNLLIFISEFMMNNDYQCGNIFIMDVCDGNLGKILRTFNFMELFKSMRIVTEGYGAKLKGMFILSHSTLVDKVGTIIRPVLSDKLKQRFHILKSRSDLKNFIDPVEILPEEYGGTAPSTKILLEKLREYVTTPSYIKLMEEMNAARTDEEKRSNYIFNDQYMGMPGTFRTLNLE